MSRPPWLQLPRSSSYRPAPRSWPTQHQVIHIRRMPQPTRREAWPSLRLATHHVTAVDHPATFLVRLAPHAWCQLLCLRARVSLSFRTPPHSSSVPAFVQQTYRGELQEAELQPSWTDGRSAVSDRRLLLTQDTQSRPGRSGCRGKGCAPQLCLSRLALCRDHQRRRAGSANRTLLLLR